MSFTQDELQALNSILEQRLSAHRRELERSLDHRFNAMRREFEQRLVTLNQELLRVIPRHLNIQQARMKEALGQVTSSLREGVKQSQEQGLERHEERQQIQFQQALENSLAAQLLAIEELIKQYVPEQDTTLQGMPQAPEFEFGAEYDAIELQTEISWDDMASVVDKVVEQRLTTTSDSLQERLLEVQNYLAVQMQSLHADLLQHLPSFPNGMTSIQEIFSSIQQLEHIIESMQVAMNANHALLSNRIYHHQQLPLERAHTNNHTPRPPSFSSNIKKSSFPLLTEHDEEEDEHTESSQEL
ncbi:hypothetical protein [Ktedonospora formicarum]|uniref:Uncharacterized protein n=1 Tax=Ktedonospora formicarum TaxID=2778364 RepID=A0A8J3MRW4_9CHLR|nr:hypothetical protein [Ktedonospora formicarum]GHO42710.1 hypothetical protein KSX_08730 [Ktedonospora formicarum]